MNDIVKKSIKIPESRFKEASFARTQWQVIAEHGTTLEDIKKPEYWAHVAKQLKITDEITVICEDMTFKVNLDVLDKSNTWAKVFVTDYIDYTEATGETMPEAPQKEFKVKWGGPHVKYQVIRAEDSEVVKEYFATEADAYNYLRDYSKVMAA
jgi:hypothetical protein